jgi:hypothetical protein
LDFDTIRAAIAASGLAWRGALYPSDGAYGRTIVLVGFAGNAGWPEFAASPEAGDHQPDPLDRWSRRVITALAESLGATPLFPFGGPPFLPFQRWAQAAEPVRPSPLGILIHPDWGLWHSYRGALAFAERLTLPEPDLRPSPCETCAERPCLTACPVSAFTPAGYDIPACTSHISSPDGVECMARGCRARAACPVGTEHAYRPDRASFHMQAFRAAMRRA